MSAGAIPVLPAVRDAANRELILAQIERETGGPSRYLAGEDEGRLTYLVVHHWYGWSAGRLPVPDIGGGSMEIILSRDAEPDLVGRCRWALAC